MMRFKRIIAVTLVCLFVFAAMQIAASATNGAVVAQEMNLSGSFGEFMLRMPFYLVNLAFTFVKAPFYFFGKIFGL